MDLFSPNADDSGSDGNEDTQQEASRRRQRHERNAYLHEKRVSSAKVSLCCEMHVLTDCYHSCMTGEAYGILTGTVRAC